MKLVIKPLTRNAPAPKGFWGRLMIRKMNIGHAKMTAWAFEQLNLKTARAVVDIGCGGGKAVKRLASLAPEAIVYGVDRSPLCVEQAARENKKYVAAGRVVIRSGSAGALPFPDASVDVITAVETVYFWNDWPKAFRDVRRVLKPGGIFAVVCDMVDDGDGTVHYQEVTRLVEMQIPSPTQLERAFLDAGFSDIRLCRHPQGWLCAVAKRPEAEILL